MTLRRYIAPSRVLGAYRHHLVSGSMGGLAAGAEIASLRNASTKPVAIRRILFGFAGYNTPFAPEQYKFELFLARSFTVADSGGTAATLTTDNGKLKTAFDTTTLTDFRVSSGAAITAGTRTVDATALAAIAGVFSPEGRLNNIPSGTPLFGGILPDDWPIVLEANEGLVLKATLPTIGVWCFDVGVDYQTYEFGAI